MQLLFYDTQDKYSNDNRDDMTLIADHINLPQSEEYFLRLLDTFRSNGPSILQVRVYHNHTDDRTEKRIRTEHFRRTECNQNWQEHIGYIAEQYCKLVNRTICINIQEAVIHHEIQRFHNSH